jgi:hypothetical protein
MQRKQTQQLIVFAVTSIDPQIALDAFESVREKTAADVFVPQVSGLLN